MNELPERSSPFLARPPDRRGRTQGPLRVAFLGRTSTDDQQDPTISIPRQLRACRDVLPPHAVIVAQFYDVESGRRDLAHRGRSRRHEGLDIPVRRDGGIQDLLDEATEADRRFDAVICESVDRIARRTYFGVMVEHTLQRAGIVLMAADEPASISDRRAHRATGILTRRIKQGVAEWYVLDMLEKSWAGFEEHTLQGFNIGSVPYGYQAQRIPHPVPARRAEGKTKTRLICDPVRGPVVKKIFTWRVGQRLSYQAIADRLNADPDIYPPPAPPDPSRAVGAWTFSAVRGILTNPKYTGYMVWNRRATKTAGGKANPVEEWVYSPSPAHPSIITLDTFQQAAQIGQYRQGSRDTTILNRTTSHTDTTADRTYLLRSQVFCQICGHRMFGTTRRDHPYMICTPRRGQPPVHAASFTIRQAALLDGLRIFFTTRLFSPDRTATLSTELREQANTATTQHTQTAAELQKQLSDIAGRQRHLVSALESCGNPNRDFIDAIQLRLAELHAERHRIEQAHQQLRHHAAAVANPNLLDLLPTGVPDLKQPEILLRRLYQLCRLEIRYQHPTRIATYRCTLTGETIHDLSELAAKHLVPTDVAADPAEPTIDGQLVLTARIRLGTNEAAADDPATAIDACPTDEPRSSSV